VHSYQRVIIDEEAGMVGEEGCGGVDGNCCCAMTTSEITLPKRTRASIASMPSSSALKLKGRVVADASNLNRLTMKLKVGERVFINFFEIMLQLQTLHSEELEIIGLPIYDQKRNLVERVVEGVAELFRGASSVVLWSALERLLADGLNEGGSVWAVVVEVTSPGPITNSIFQLVKSLEGGERPESARLCYFFKELLR